MSETFSMPVEPSTTINNAASSHQFRILCKDEYKQAALCLAEAFKDDEVAMYFIKTGDRHDGITQEEWNLHVYIMECMTYAHLLRGLVTAIGPNYDCVALWMPPASSMDDSIFAPIRRRISSEGKKRFFNEFLPLLHRTKHEVLGKHDDSSWYLVYIGTKVGSRGKGYAKTLIEYTTKQADLSVSPSYLECSNSLNLKFYGKLGFQKIKTISLKRGTKDVEMDVMVRGPGGI